MPLLYGIIECFLNETIESGKQDVCIEKDSLLAILIYISTKLNDELCSVQQCFCIFYFHLFNDMCFLLDCASIVSLTTFITKSLRIVILQLLS